MSGGSFGFSWWQVENFADNLADRLANHNNEDFQPETTAKLREILKHVQLSR